LVLNYDFLTNSGDLFPKMSGHTNGPFRSRMFSVEKRVFTTAARFFLVQTYHNGTLYQRTTNYTQRPYIKPNGHKINKKYQHFQFYGPPKYTQIGISGLKINHSGNPGFDSTHPNLGPTWPWMQMLSVKKRLVARWTHQSTFSYRNVGVQHFEFQIMSG
jgi:hypothetical protein